MVGWDGGPEWTNMRTVIIGPGAMGCLFAALLTEFGHDVWLLDKSETRAGQIAQSGIRVEGIGGVRLVRPKATSRPDDIGAADLVFIWVKAYDTASAVSAAMPVIAGHTQVISLQNGLGNLESIARVVPPQNIIGGITSHGATLLDTGSVRHAGKGDTIIGRMRGQTDGGLQELADLLSEAGIQTTISPDIEAAIWSKLMVNAAINPLTAITRLKNGQLLESPETRRLLDLVIEETERIVACTGVALLYSSVRDRVYAVCEATAGNRSSMLQDVLRGRRTEIDAINGALIEKSMTLNIQAPVNKVLVCLVKVLEGRRGDIG